jgi:hypothetical protein
MILKGNARKNGKELASHLLNASSNEHVELAELRGFAGDDLHQAFAEIEAIATGTKADKYLYSLSINPNDPLTREQYQTAIDHIEKKLGLTDQARAIVFHVKEGREHAHVVWSKINAEKMQAVHMAFDRQTLREASQELAREFGHDLPEGLKADRGNDRYSAQFDKKDFAELKQEERSGLSIDDRRSQITDAYHQSDSLSAFSYALEDRGFYLAKGDRRGVVVVDLAGEVHSLTRQIKDATAKDIKAQLNLASPDGLMSVQEAKRLIVDRARAQAEQRGAQEQKKQAERIQAKQAELKAMQGDHTATLEALKIEQVEMVGDSTKAIKEAYRDEWREVFKRQQSEAKELNRFISPLVRFGHVLTNKDWQENIALDFKGAVIPALQAIIKGKPNMAKLEHAHALERRELGNMQKLATNEEVKAIKSEIVQKRKEATKSYKVDVEILRASIERSTDNQESKRQGGNKKPASTRKAFSDRVKQATSTKDFQTATREAKEQARREQEQTRDNSGRSKL